MVTSGTSSMPWRLLTVAGTPASSCGSSSAARRDCGPLAAGTYQIEVISDGVATSDVHFQRLTVPHACGVPICDQLSATIAPNVDSDLFRFDATAASVQVAVAETSASFSAEWRLVNGAGIPASACGSYTTAAASTCGPLAAGTYHIEVASAVGSGSYNVSISPPCGSPPTTTTTSTTTSTSTSTVTGSSTTTSTSTTTTSTIPPSCQHLDVASTAISGSDEFCVNLLLTNTTPIRAVQGAIVDVPDEFDFATIECAGGAQGYSCSANQIDATNQVRFVVLDLGGGCIAAGSGPIAQVCFRDKAPTCGPDGTPAAQLVLDEATLADCASHPVPVCTQNGDVLCERLLGGCDADDDLDIFDVILMIDLVLRRTSPTAQQQIVCDGDCDGDIDIFDVLREVDAVLQRIPTPLVCPAAAASRADQLSSTDGRSVAPASASHVNVRGGSVRLTNATAVRGLELSLRASRGRVRVTGARPARRTKGFTVAAHQNESDGTVKLVIVSLTGEAIPAGHGPIARLKIARTEPRSRMRITAATIAE
jgi:hypothetical protein